MIYWSGDYKTGLLSLPYQQPHQQKKNKRERNGYIHIIHHALCSFIFMLGSKFVRHLEPYSCSTFFSGLQGFQILMFLTLGSENLPCPCLFLLQVAQV